MLLVKYMVLEIYKSHVKCKGRAGNMSVGIMPGSIVKEMVPVYSIWNTITGAWVRETLNRVQAEGYLVNKRGYTGEEARIALNEAMDIKEFKIAATFQTKGKNKHDEVKGVLVRREGTTERRVEK